VANAAWRGPLTWRNPEQQSLEEQLLEPLLGTEPIVEMGMGGHEGVLIDRLCETDGYVEAFEAAFPDEPSPIHITNLARAIASYERSIISADSPYDRRLLGDEAAMSEAALRGQELFEGDRMNCWRCHSGPFLDLPILDDGSMATEPGFFNIGLYNFDGEGSYPLEDTGLHAITGQAADMGRFRTPSLRNVAVTGPWAHDGSVASLEGMVESYARGGRLLTSGAYAGDGADSPLKEVWLSGFEMSEDEADDLLAFLESLTDEGVLTDPQFANPFCVDPETDLLDCIEPVMGPGSD
jgi:cytochrome c peroxidase